jgi:hypothetical protein
MPVTLDLLYLPIPNKDTADALFPWEQSEPLRVLLDTHTATCPVCTWRTTPIFGAAMTHTTVAPACEEGEGLAQRMREVAQARRAGSKPSAG